MTALTDATNAVAGNHPDSQGTCQKRSSTPVGETTMQIFRIGGSMEMTSSDYLELRNYVYGINGRY